MYDDDEVLGGSPDLEDEELEDLPEELKEGADDYGLEDPEDKYH
jgi:hypothetical protein